MERDAAIENLRDLLGRMQGDDQATSVCLQMMNWLIRDIEIFETIDLQLYKDIWGKAQEIHAKKV